MHCIILPATAVHPGVQRTNLHAVLQTDVVWGVRTAGGLVCSYVSKQHNTAVAGLPFDPQSNISGVGGLNPQICTSAGVSAARGFCSGEALVLAVK